MAKRKSADHEAMTKAPTAKDDATKRPAAGKQAEPKVEQPAAVSETGRSPGDADPGDIPMNIDARGDAHPITFDPLLDPQSQQPGEPYEDYLKRTGKDH